MRTNLIKFFLISLVISSSFTKLAEPLLFELADDKVDAEDTSSTASTSSAVDTSSTASTSSAVDTSSTASTSSATDTSSTASTSSATDTSSTASTSSATDTSSTASTSSSTGSSSSSTGSTGSSSSSTGSTGSSSSSSSSALPPKCSVFKCKTITGDICSQSTTTATPGVFAVGLKVCAKKGQTCPGFPTPKVDDQTCADVVVSNKKFPGESCTTTDTCLGIVTACASNGKCPGGLVDEACTSSTTCAVGNGCSSVTGKCIKQITDSTTPCLNEYECANNMGCNGTCQNYFSVDNGKTVPNGGAKLCKSGFAWSFDNNVTYVCIDTTLPLDTRGKTPWVCGANDSTCTYNIAGGPQGTTTINQPCLCSLSDPQLQYCSADTTSSKFKGLLNSKSLINSGVHSNRRGAANTNKLAKWPQYEGADSCVTSMLNNNSTYVSLSLVLLAILALLL